MHRSLLTRFRQGQPFTLIRAFSSVDEWIVSSEFSAASLSTICDRTLAVLNLRYFVIRVSYNFIADFVVSLCNLIVGLYHNSMEDFIMSLFHLVIGASQTVFVIPSSDRQG